MKRPWWNERPWPGVPSADSAKAGPSRWLFTPGYGLRYPTRRDLPELPVHADIKACSDTTTLPVFHTLALAPFSLYLADDAHGEHAVGSDLNGEIAWPAAHPSLRLRTVQVNTQQDAKAVTWLAPGRLLARTQQPVDLSKLAASHAALQFDVVVDAPAQGPVTLAMHCGKTCGGHVELGSLLAQYASGARQIVRLVGIDHQADLWSDCIAHPMNIFDVLDVIKTSAHLDRSIARRHRFQGARDEVVGAHSRRIQLHFAAIVAPQELPYGYSIFFPRDIP